MNQQELKEYFVYDENSPTCLRRLKLTHKNCKSGIAGTKSKGKRYYWVSFKQKHLLIHRIIYKLFNPEFDIFNLKQEIDHINGDRFDNKIQNLRVVSRTENCKNRVRKDGSTCPYTGLLPLGVSYYSRANKYTPPYEYYAAHWVKEDGEFKSAIYGIAKYGQNEALRKAIERRNKEFGNLSGYTERHGR